MSIAVTGASGFIGAALAERLRDDGHAVIGIDVAGEPDRRADVADPAAVVAALAGADAVVHAAAIVAERGRMDDFVRVNVRGTRNVLDAAGGRRTLVVASAGSRGPPSRTGWRGHGNGRARWASSDRTCPWRPSPSSAATASCASRSTGRTP